MGFELVIEAHSGRRYPLSPDCNLTFLVNGQDSVMILEAGGQVLVNVNDALHASDPATIAMFTRELRTRWPRIETVFCGFGGASYFPNAFHAPGKDDVSIGRLREEFFVMNFCRIIAGLEPAVAVPFAADFVLLDERQQWINACRFPRENIAQLFDAHYRPPGCTTRIAPMYSGDILENGVVKPTSPYRPRLLQGEMDQLIHEQYPHPTSAFQVDQRLSEEDADEIATTLQAHIDSQIGFFPERMTDGLIFSVQLLDVEGANFYVISHQQGRTRIERRPAPHPEGVAQITTSSAPLIHSLTEDWGGDDLLIGYGCHVEATSQENLPRARICTELLLKLPRPGAYLRRRPLRASRYVWENRAVTVDKIKRRVSGIPGSITVGGNFWITESPAVIRRHLRIPE
jgi:hypothetical protein